MKLYGAIVVYNEEPIVKYVMPYLIRYGFDKLFIYNDGSTDNTIDLIKSYNCDFIEFKDFSIYKDKVIKECFDYAKACVFADLFLMGKNISKSCGEDIWVYHSDFDEILFNASGDSIKEHIAQLDNFGFNYFAGRMINLVKGDDSFEELPHTFTNTKCFYWNYYGQKSFLLKCNDFTEYNYLFGNGNHVIQLQLEDGKVLSNLYEFGEFYCFHLKYFTYDYFLYKNIKNYKKNINYILYSENEKIIKEKYKCETSQKFPIEIFYALNGFFIKNDLPILKGKFHIVGNINIYEK